jgi:hypothetical protein
MLLLWFTQPLNTHWRFLDPGPAPAALNRTGCGFRSLGSGVLWRRHDFLPLKRGGGSRPDERRTIRLQAVEEAWGAYSLTLAIHASSSTFSFSALRLG